jgi:hypothetical protein
MRHTAMGVLVLAMLTLEPGIQEDVTEFQLEADTGTRGQRVGHRGSEIEPTRRRIVHRASGESRPPTPPRDPEAETPPSSTWKAFLTNHIKDLVLVIALPYRRLPSRCRSGCDPGPRATPNHPLQYHRASHRAADNAADRRDLPLG